MDSPQNDFDRLFFFELARKTSEETYAKNPLDAENLTRWGAALLELSQFQSGPDTPKYLKDATSKLEEALEVNPKRPDTLWVLGNVLTSHGFTTSDHDTAMVYFEKATKCFQEASDEDPGNELYIKALEMSTKAPSLHMEIQRQMVNQQGAVGGPSASNVKVSKKKKQNSDLKYDIFGWVILGIALVAWVGMAKSHVPPPPPPR